MPRYLLHHRHVPSDCRAVFAAFKGHTSPLRRGVTLSSCPSGAHDGWWTVEADSGQEALALLPFFVAERTEVTRVEEIQIP
jgi:hypothetical protein